MAVTAERAGLMAIGAGCLSPFALHAEVRGERLHLWGMMADENAANARWLDEVAPVERPLTAGAHLAELLRGGSGGAGVTGVKNLTLPLAYGGRRGECTIGNAGGVPAYPVLHCACSPLPPPNK